MTTTEPQSCLHAVPEKWRITSLSSLIWLCTLLFLVASSGLRAECTDRGFDANEQSVINAYIAYYGRPADPAGLEFWRASLEETEGDLSGIIESFGVSAEFDSRFGALSNTQLVTNLYQQLFGRDPEPAGLDFYVSSLDANEITLQSASLIILGGATGDDFTTLENRSNVTKHYVTQLEENGATDVVISADDLAAVIAEVDQSIASATTACATVDALVATATGSTNAQTAAPNSIRSTGLGDVYTNVSGLPLYYFDNDEANVSNCDEACQTTWPIVAATPSAEPMGDFGIIEHSNGTRQWTWRSRPLYLFTADSADGDPLCDQPDGLWHVVRPDQFDLMAPNSVRSTGIGDVFTNSNGLPLYHFDSDELNQSNCDADCLAIWPRAEALPDSVPSGEFGIIENEDGTRQWTWRSMPLYLFSSDSQTGDPLCDQPEGLWHVARPDDFAVPNNIRSTGLGDVYTTPEGMPLYFFDNDTENTSNCDADCQAVWPRVQAAANSQPVGDFGIIDHDDGTRQWTYRSKPLYLFSSDSTTGDPLCDQPEGLWHVLRPDE